MRSRLLPLIQHGDADGTVDVRHSQVDAFLDGVLRPVRGPRPDYNRRLS